MLSQGKRFDLSRFVVVITLTCAAFGVGGAQGQEKEATSAPPQTVPAPSREPEPETTSNSFQALLAAPAEPLLVAVSTGPEAYFVERIGGSRVRTQVLVAPGQSHHTYDPTPREMADLSRADVYLRIGMPFEESLLRKVLATRKDFRSVDIAKDVTLIAMSGGESDEAAKGDAEEGGDEDRGPTHAHGEPDPHVWLDPARVEIMARAICAALIEIQPGGGPFFEKNLDAFVNELGQTDEKVAAILAPFKGRTIYVYHPAFGYFASAYGLRQAAVETEGKEPGARHTVELIERAKADGAKAIYVQREFSSKTPAAVAEAVGGKVVTLDPLSRDYLANLVKMAEAIRDGFSDGVQPHGAR